VGIETKKLEKPVAFPARERFSATLALSRVDRLIGRTISIFMLVSLYECISVFSSQYQYLNPVWSVAGISLFSAALFFNIANFWFFGARNFGYVVHGIAVAILVATWQFQLASQVDPGASFQPWIWWATGGASLAMGILLPRWWAWAYMIGMPAVWFVMLQTPLGGEADLAKASQDGAFVTLFPAAMVTLTHLLRNSARKVDEATDLVATAAADRARIDAIERERLRVEALMHDSVLNTLLVSSRATDSAEHQSALDLANQAIDRLSKAGDDDSDSLISLISFSQALNEAIARQSPNIEVSFSGASNASLPLEVASALTDATLQAVSNSLEHGNQDAKRFVLIKANAKEIKVVISDDGPGFRVSRIAKSRLGLRLSIIKRVESIGGRVFINTQPGDGTTIVLEWDLK
jgi:signal transduction histidine kinase